jgi:hypothetical protein
MKIDQQDIIDTARQLRDEENDQLHVRPWSRHRRSHIPTWLVAVPAAAIIGFIIGLWTKDSIQSGSPLTALADTVYIEVPAPQPPQDSIVQEAIPAVTTSPITTPTASMSQSAVSNPSPRQVRQSSAPTTPQQPVGRPVTDDHIRYDLLVRN